MDVWYPLAPANDMVQKARLGQVRVELRLQQASQLIRSKKVPPASLEEVREAMNRQPQLQVQPLAAAAAAVVSNPLKFLRDRIANRSKQPASPKAATVSGFGITRERSFLKIRIIEGRKLIAADFLTSDPFVKIVLVREKDDKEEYTKLKTDIKSKTLSPKWQNQEFVLGKTEATMLSDKKAVVLRVMDHDLTSADDPMGYLRIDFQRDKSGCITGLSLVHADEKGNPVIRPLHLNPENRVEIDERLLADEKAGQSKSASARGNNGVTDGKLGRLKFVVELMQNENFVDPNAVTATKMTSIIRSLESKFSLEVCLKKVTVVGKAASRWNADWKQFTCTFIPQGDGGQRVYYDHHTEDLGAGNSLRLSDLLSQGGSDYAEAMSDSMKRMTTKVLGRTYDMSKVAFFEVQLASDSLGKVFNGRFGQQGQFKRPDVCSSFPDEVIVLKDKDGSDLALHVTVDVNVVAIHRAERVKRLLAETFRLVGLQFDARAINHESTTSSGAHAVASSSVQQFLWDTCKANVFSGLQLNRELLSQVHRMSNSSKLHWKFTPQLLGYVLEHVFLFGEKDRLAFNDAVALDNVLNRWSQVLHHVNDAKNQLIGHLHGRETPRLMCKLLTDCDWSGFELVSLPNGTDSTSVASVDDSTDQASSARSEHLLRPGMKVHALLPPCKHPGVAVDLRLVSGHYVAGTIVAEYGDDSVDIAFCTSAKVRDEGDEYFSDDEELPPLLQGHEVLVCPFAPVESSDSPPPSHHSHRKKGRNGVVVEVDEAGHAQTPYLVSYSDDKDPKQEWVSRIRLDSMFRNVYHEDVSVQLAKDDFVRVLESSPLTDISTDSTSTVAVGRSRLAKIVKNRRNARYDVEYQDGQTPLTQNDVPRNRLQPCSDKVLYEGIIQHVYVAATDSTEGYAVKYDVLLRNGDVANSLSRELLRHHGELFPADKPVVASLFFSDLTIFDKNSVNLEQQSEMARQVNELWSHDQLVKVYVMMKAEPQRIQLRDSVTNKLIQTRLHERSEDTPRFIDHCHGFVKGERFTDVEASKLAQIFETRAVMQDSSAALAEAESFNVNNCFCLYLAPLPHVEMHGLLHIYPGQSATSLSLFKGLLGLVTTDKTSFSQIFQRLLRSTASEHMPLNRRERYVSIKGVQVCFYRKPVTNLSMNALTSTCDGDILESVGPDGKRNAPVPMRRVGLAHVSINVTFEVAFTPNNRGSLAEALCLAHQDASAVLDRLAAFNTIKLVEDVNVIGFGSAIANGVWSLSTTEQQPEGEIKPARPKSSAADLSLHLEVVDSKGKKGSKPSLSLELLPLDDIRLSVQDATGQDWELCLPMDRILVESQLRRYLSPYFLAKVVEGPIQASNDHTSLQQKNKRRRRDSLLLSKPTEPFKKSKKLGNQLPPLYKVEFKDTKKSLVVPLHDIKFDSLNITVLQASELALKEKMGGGDIEADVMLLSSDFEPQLEGGGACTTPFGVVLSEAGEICRDLGGKSHPQQRVLLTKKPNSVEWIAGSTSPSLSFGFPNVDVTRVSGVTIRLRTKSDVIGWTTIDIGDIPTITASNESKQQGSRSGNIGSSLLASMLPRKSKSKDGKVISAAPTSQTFPVYRKEHGQLHVVGKVLLQLVRTQHVEQGDTVLAKRFEEEQDAWSISSYELLATTLQQQEDQLMRGLLATNTIVPNGDTTLLKDPIEQELQLQKLVNVMMISHAMETIYATKSGEGTENDSLLKLRDGSEVSSPRVAEQIRQVLAQTRWLIEDTAAEFGIRTTGRRLPWSSDHVDDEPKGVAARDQLVVVKANLSSSSVRLRRTMLKLYQMYRNRLIPTLKRLYELDAMGDRIDMKAGEQLLAFFDEEVEDLDSQDQVVYRRVYQRLRLIKIAEVLKDILHTTLRVTIMDQDPDIGDDAVGTAYIPMIDLLDQVEHDYVYELQKSKRATTGSSAMQSWQGTTQATSPARMITIKKGKVHLRLHLRFSESSLLEQATNIFKFLKAKYIVQHENARRRINAAVVPAQRRRWMTIKGYLDELNAQAHGKLHWERTPVLLSLVWDIFSTPQKRETAADVEDEQHLQGLADKANEYRNAVVQVHTRWANLQPKLEELLQIQAATQIHAQRTPRLLEEIEREVEGLDLVLSTAWHQVHKKWMILYEALEELASMKERNKLHLGRAPHLLHLVAQRCSKGLSERHADAVSNVQFRWMAITQADGPLCELRLMEKKGLHWRRTHELVLLLNEQCEGFAEVDAKSLDIVQKRWEQVQEWLDDVVQMQVQHTIDCEATPFILNKLHLMDSRSKSRRRAANTSEKKVIQSPLSSPTASSPTSGASRDRASTVSASGSAPVIDVEEDVGRLEGMAEWYAIEEAKRELERVPYHRIRTDYDRANWLQYSQDGKDTRLFITQQDMSFTPHNVRAALIDRGVIPQISTFDAFAPPPPSSPTRGGSKGNAATTTTLPKDLLDEIQELERALAHDDADEVHNFVKWNPERIAELHVIIESLGKSDLLWKINHCVNSNKELEVPDNFVKLLEEMRMRQIPTTEIEDLARSLMVTLQKEELAKAGVNVPPNANFTTVLTLMHRHMVKDIILPTETSAIQALLHERSMDKKGDPVYHLGMRIGTQSWNPDEDASSEVQNPRRGRAASGTTRVTINTGLGIIDTQVELLRKSLLSEALRKRNSLVKSFPGETRILAEEETSEWSEVDMSGDYMTLINRFQQLLIHESYTKRLAEYAGIDRSMRALLRVPRDQIVTREDIALALQPLGPRYRLPVEAFTREELVEAAKQGKIRTPTEEMLARCPRGRNAAAMAYYAAVSHAAIVFEETVSFRARLDPVTQRFVDAFPFEDPSSVDGLSIPKDRSRMNLKSMLVDWLLGSEESIIKIERRFGAYHRQRLVWASAAFTLRNRWFHRGYGWCDDPLKGAGVKVLLQKLLLFENANKMHMINTEALLNDINDKCTNLRLRERQAKEALENRYHSNLDMLEKLVGHAEKCINNRKLHTEETPALLHAIEQVCVVPHGLSARHREAYHVVTSHWIPHRARLAELVQMHKEGTFSIDRTPELLTAMEYHTEGIGGADELNEGKVYADAERSTAPDDLRQQFVERKVDEIRRGQRKQSSSLRLDLEDPHTEKDAVIEEMSTQDNNVDWQSLSPSKRVLQPLSPRDKQTSWKVVGEASAASPSPTKLAVVLEPKHVTEVAKRKSSIGDEIKEILRSPSKWLMASTDPAPRINPESLFPQALSLDTSHAQQQQQLQGRPE
ncbi:hypothetical protein PINS_up003175 [Pythium insidiosum]|nr:hypothetical protein PINS_up003175 [Pythium insidiosum]